MVLRMMSHARPRPMTSLQMASKTWLTEVGVMLLWPWKKPRKAEMMQINSTAGARAAMEAQELGLLITPAASHLAPSSMPREPTMPSSKKTRRAVEKILRI